VGVITSAEVAELVATLRASGLAVDEDRPLGPLTTYRVGGPAAAFVEVATDDELAALAAAVAAGPRVPVLVVGRGSNLLVADAGFGGVAVQLSGAFESIDVGAADGAPGDVATVGAGGAASLPVVARRTAAAGLRGFEWAVGVPGSIGGAVRMNAGGHGSDMAAVLAGVRVVDLATGEDGWMGADRLDLSYRHSSIGPTRVVAAAELRLVRGSASEAEDEVAEVVRWRRANQPGGTNAGSVFTNPPGDSAGRLADAAGCKGRRRGTAVVSSKHANFIQADAGGSADDVVALMAEVRAAVAEVHGVELVAETRLVGFDDDVATAAGRNRTGDSA
jgi:UDP-N-acetylmuramate dehydrogenase